MFASAIVYVGFALALAGALLLIRPVRRLGLGTRPRALAVAAAGLVIVTAGLVLPARTSRIAVPASRLDRFVPAWQFAEFHDLAVAAPPSRVYDAMRAVRADEIALFRTLTWIRRGGQALAPGVLNAGVERPLIDVATGTTFIMLADSAPHELVIGTAVIAPPGATALTPTLFTGPPPGYALAAMNFVVTADGAGGSLVTTATRVYASDAATRRRFAAYWRLIYPGSALIRRMWLRAIRRRAMEAGAAAGYEARRASSLRMVDQLRLVAASPSTLASAFDAALSITPAGHQT